MWVSGRSLKKGTPGGSRQLAGNKSSSSLRSQQCGVVCGWVWVCPERLQSTNCSDRYLRIPGKYLKPVVQIHWKTEEFPLPSFFFFFSDGVYIIESGSVPMWLGDVLRIILQGKKTGWKSFQLITFVL